MYSFKLKHILLKTNLINFLLICIGIFLRIKVFLENRSFWLDEAWVAAETVNRSLKDILINVRLFSEFPQSIGFSLIIKISTILFGNNEYAFRFFPLLCGIISIFLFYFILKKITSPEVQTIALGLFVFSYKLIYYSAELKSYSCAVMITLGLILIFLDSREKQFPPYSFTTLTLTGALSMWLSNSSIFIIATIGILLIFYCFKIKKIKHTIFTLFIWILNFLCLYKLCLYQMSHNQTLHNMWQKGFLPVPFSFLKDILWLKHTILSLFKDPAGFSFPLLTFTLFILGIQSLFKKDKEILFLLISPLSLALIASILQKYPFQGRLLLFSLPALLLLVAEGVVYFIQIIRFYLNKLGKRQLTAIWVKTLIIYAITASILAILFYKCIYLAGYHIIHKDYDEGNRIIMQGVAKYAQPNDLFILNRSSQFQYLYYISRFNLVSKMASKTAVLNKKLIKCQEILKTSDSLYKKNGNSAMPSCFILFSFTKNRQLSGVLQYTHNPLYLISETTPINLKDYHRVWLILSHIKPEAKEFLIKTLNKNGKLLLKINSSGNAIAYLYKIP